LRLLIRARAIVVILFVALLGATWWVYRTAPSGFVPEENQGYVMVLIQGPPGASLDYTMNIVRQTEQTMMGLGQTKTMFAAGGFGFTRTSPNQGILFAPLKDLKEAPGDT